MTNAGSVASDGTPVVLRDVVPAGLAVSGASGPEGPCAVSGQTVECVDGGMVAPDGVLHFVVGVTVVEPAVEGPVANVVSVSGGGGREVSVSATNQISGGVPAFGASGFSFFIGGLDGAVDSEAGGHPYELTTTIDLNSVLASGKELGSVVTSVHDLKDVVVDLPLGFVGSVLAAPECTLAQLSSISLREGTGGCPKDTIVGYIRTEPVGQESAESPIWNLVPERGVPAEFGFVDHAENTHVFYAHVVPTAAGYVLQVRNTEIPQIIVSHIVVSFYGNPAVRDGTGNAEVPFFTNPTACEGGDLVAKVWLDSWQDPARFNADGTPDLSDPNWASATSSSPPVTGCDELSFTPQLFAQPTTSQADSPSGLEFELKLPQTENAGVHATPAMRNATVVFPEGMTVDPSSGSGLQACSEAQIGWEGPTLFDFNLAPPGCPEQSKIGSLELESPLVSGVLQGEVFLAAQNANPFGSTFAAYIIVNDPVTGVVLKLAGELRLNPGTGRITGFFPEAPQLPFSDLKMHFFGGPRATLATPDSCGTFTTTSSLEPWSAPDSGPNGMPFASFVIDEGCVSGFAPSFSAGSTNLQAGAYTTFQASFSRQDDEQELGGLSVALPEGLLANIGSVPECTEAQIQAAREDTGGCPESTKVGTVTAGAGPGPNPLFVTGNAYLTGPYNGGPYGLAVIVPAVAGPFQLGNVVVRQSLRINQLTSVVTDVSDPFPTILDPVGANDRTNGVPIKLRRVDVSIDRANFAFNPTSCDKLNITGAFSSITGQPSSLTVPFQVTNCTTLKFEPKLTVTTKGQASKAKGASLSFKIAFPKSTPGTQTWLEEAKFELPKQLPARLTTLQKACLAKTFEENPSHCPAASKIGTAIVHSPILNAPFTGPVYFVSYGGAKFPEAVLLLEADGIKIQSHGETFINKKTGVTSATFRNIPDAPIETIEVTVPKGPYSEFGTNIPEKDHYNLCGQHLTLPTHFKASNGQQTTQQTPIAITNCKKHATHKKH